MLGIYEKRRFIGGEKIWLGSYKNLTNVLHWHFECEIIRVIKGNAEIKIGDFCFAAKENDCFFCAGEELHYIISKTDTLMDVMIFDEEIVRGIADKYVLATPKLSDNTAIQKGFEQIKKELSAKESFYCEAIENCAKRVVIDIFRNNCHKSRNDNSQFYKNLISKINDEAAFITFDDAVCYSGYSASHFSKMFKKLSGMNFSEYLNVIRVENAITMLRNNSNISMTTISSKCGFSTVRNFNRVFKKITGYSPCSLPKDFIINTGLRISKSESFDPTDKNSILI